MSDRTSRHYSSEASPRFGEDLRGRRGFSAVKGPLRIVAAAAVAFVGLAAIAAAQARHPLSGRILAPTMSVAGAPWLERPEREGEEAPSKALDALDLKAGMVVADIGAGSGYYTVRLARRVGPSGRVYATDIQQGMIDLLNRRKVAERLDNITTVLGGVDDPRLPPRSIDLALMVDVYHELAAPQIFLRRLREALKPDGRLVLLEFRKEDPRIPIFEVHKMSVEEVRIELDAEGYAIDRLVETLPWQHLFVLKMK
jgi:SAM-dependent methyltransferase